jgi:hypothetical protein
MRCNEARQHWNLYHDSEGDAELHFQISEHLGVCPACAEWFAQQSRLEALLAEKLRSQPRTPALWQQVLSRCGLKRRVAARRWFWSAGLAACVTVAVALFWYFSRPPDLAKLTAAWHRRLAAAEETLPFRSTSDLKVEGFLREQVRFPVRCPPRKDTGFAVQGAGVCRLADQPAAYLCGSVDGAPVSVFVLARDSLAAFPHQAEALHKEKTHRCQEGPYAMVLGVIDQNAVLVIGQTDTDRLDRVLRGYGSYPEHH